MINPVFLHTIIIDPSRIGNDPNLTLIQTIHVGFC